MNTEQKQNVLFLTPLPPPVHGVSFINSLLVKKMDCKYNLTVIKLNNTIKLSQIGKINFGKINFFKNLFYQIKSTLKHNYFDIVYYPISSRGAAMFRDIILIWMIKKRTKAKVVLHVRGRDFFIYKKNYFVKSILKTTFSNTFVIQHSANLVQDIDWFGAKYKHRFFLPNGIPMAAACKKTYSNKTPVNLLFLSVKTYNKGIFVLMQALDFLLKNNVDFVINFIGDYASQKVKTNLYDMINNIEFGGRFIDIGAVHGAEKEKYFMDADIFIFPTMRESFGNVVLEAMSYGVPVIASDEGALPEILDNGNSGVLFKKGDSENLAVKLSELIKNPDLRKEKGINGKLRFVSNYSFEKFENNMDEIFKKITKKEETIKYEY